MSIASASLLRLTAYLEALRFTRTKLRDGYGNAIPWEALEVLGLEEEDVIPWDALEALATERIKAQAARSCRRENRGYCEVIYWPFEQTRRDREALETEASDG